MPLSTISPHGPNLTQARAARSGAGSPATCASCRGRTKERCRSCGLGASPSARKTTCTPTPFPPRNSLAAPTSQFIERYPTRTRLPAVGVLWSGGCSSQTRRRCRHLGVLSSLRSEGCPLTDRCFCSCMIEQGEFANLDLYLANPVGLAGRSACLANVPTVYTHAAPHRIC